MKESFIYHFKTSSPYAPPSMRIYANLPSLPSLAFFKAVCGSSGGECIEQFVSLFALTDFTVRIRLMGADSIANFMVRGGELVIDVSSSEITYELGRIHLEISKAVAYAIRDFVDFRISDGDVAEQIPLLENPAADGIAPSSINGQYYEIKPHSRYTWEPKSVNDILDKYQPTRPASFHFGKLRLKMRDGFNGEPVWPEFGWGGRCHVGGDLFFLFAQERVFLDRPFEAVFVRDLMPPYQNEPSILGPLTGDVSELREIHLQEMRPQQP